MKPSRKKRQIVEDEILDEVEEDDGAPIPFEALAKLTSSEMIRQVKAGMSHIAPLESEEVDGDDASY